MKATLSWIVAVVLGVIPCRARAGQPELLSPRVPSADVTRTGNGPSVPVGFDAQGRHVFFLSAASDLAAGDKNGVRWDVFRRDLTGNRTELVSDFGPGHSGPWADALGVTVSGDGERVAFQSRTRASDLRDENGIDDLFLRRMSRTEPELVSVRADGQAAGNGASGPGLVSADGRFVVFESLATDLVSATDTNAEADVFLRDLDAGTTRLLSGRVVEGTALATGARAPLASSDAGVVVFRSSSSNLTAESTGAITDLYVWKREGAVLRRVVLPGELPAGSSGSIRVINPALSRDGRFLAFRAAAPQTWMTATPLSGVWLADLAEGVLTQISVDTDVNRSSGGDDLTGPVWSGDGRTLAFERNTATPTNPTPRIRIWRAGVGLRTLDQLSEATAGSIPEPPSSRAPVLNADGSRLAYLGLASEAGVGLPGAEGYRLFVRELVTGTTVALTSEADGGVDQPFAEFHPDGRRVLFQSEHPVPAPVQDSNGTFDVVLSDGSGGVPVNVISVAGPGRPTAAPPRLPYLAERALSADGRYVLLALLPPGGSERHVYRWDRQTSTLRLVSRGLGGGEANGSSLPIALSSDGRRALFTSLATNLVAGDTNRLEDVFLADLDADTIQRVNSQDADRQSAVRAVPIRPVLSADGRQALTFSWAPGWGYGTDGRYDLNLYDAESGRSTWVHAVQASAGGVDIRAMIRSAAVGEDGRWIAFTAGPAAPGDAFLFSRSNGQVQRLTTDGRVHALAISARSDLLALAHRHADGIRNRLAVLDLANQTSRELLTFPTNQALASLRFSADGQSLVFASETAFPVALTGFADDNGLSDVFHLDLRTGRLRLVSGDFFGKPSTAASDQPDVSADGQHVVYRRRSEAPVAASVPDLGHICVYSIATGRTTVLDSAPGIITAPGNGPATAPRLAANAGFALALSASTDLAEGLGNGLPGAFALGFAEGASPDIDSDRDGLPDDWERASFGSLAEAGTGDFDGDGQSNVAEYQSGTRPSDPGSVFRVACTMDAEGTPVLRWWGAVGVTYSVEASDTLAPAVFVPMASGLRGDNLERQFPLQRMGGTGFVRVRAGRP